jgi:hypothetical protein
MTQAIVMLRRWTLPAVLAMALALNVCGLPLESHLHPAAEEGAAAIPAGDHHDDELVSCDAHTSQLPTQPHTLLGPTASAALDAIVPVPPARGHAPIAPVSIPCRPLLFLLHASLLI